jgi:hypothetical protein
VPSGSVARTQYAVADGPLFNLKYRLRGALALRFKRIEHIDNIDHFPKRWCSASQIAF